MNTKPTDYSKNALIDIAKNIEFSDWEKEPVQKQITFSNFEDLKNGLYSILNAIEIIGYKGDATDLGTCGALAELGKKLLPTEEMCFLDSLLIKKDDSKNEFSKIENLKK
jgi:hypothetical protein